MKLAVYHRSEPVNLAGILTGTPASYGAGLYANVIAILRIEYQCH
jgi:hypothetical protein